MGFEKVEFEFPDAEETNTEIEIEESSATSPFDEPKEVSRETEAKDADLDTDCLLYTSPSPRDS